MPSLATRLAAVPLAALLALACSPPDEPAPGPGPTGERGEEPEGEGGTGDGGAGSGDGGAGAGDGGAGAGDGGAGAGDGAGGGGTGGEDVVSELVLAFAPDGDMEGATRIDLELVAIALFVDRTAPSVGDRTSCDAGGALLDARTTVTLDLTGAGDDDDRIVPFASLALESGRSLEEVWLVLRQGVLHKDGRTYKVHADLLCTMPDGLRYTLLRARPERAVALGGPDHRLLLPFEPEDRIREERIDCRVRPEEECATSDDPEDDDDPQTRLRYTFRPGLPVRVEPLSR